MDLRKIIEAARDISDRAGFITFDRLNALCPKELDAETSKPSSMPSATRASNSRTTRSISGPSQSR